MNQQNPMVSQGAVQGGVSGVGRGRRPRPVSLDKLKAERIEQPMEAAKVLEKMAGLTGWGLSPKGIVLARDFYLPGAEEARAFCDYLLATTIQQKVRMKVTVLEERVSVTLRGRRGGMPPYLLDFAAMLAP